MIVPTLLGGDGPPLVQSLVILEYLEKKYPQPPLMPLDLRARAACERACADGDRTRILF
jgi:maleylacetoacetate isomerase